MPNYSIVANSTFRPFELGELMPIYQANTQAQQQAEDAYTQLSLQSNQWEKLANNAKDVDVYQQYKAYANSLKDAADDLLNNGINVGSRRALMGLRARYASEIAPIEEAYNRRQQQSQLLWQARMQDPTLIAQDPNDLGLSFYIKNPTYTPQSYSGKLLTAQAAQAAQNLSKTLRDYGTGKNIDKYTKTFIQRHGLSKDTVQAWMNGDKNASNAVLSSIASQIYDSSNMGSWANEAQRKQALNFIGQGMWSAIGQDNIQAMDDFEAKENFKQQKQLELMQAQAAIQQQQQGAGVAVNEVPIYTPEEQKEADKMREKYSQYFYTKNGRTYLRQKGREEYEKQITTNEPVKYDSKTGKWYYVRSSMVHSGMQGEVSGNKQYVAKGTKIEYDGNTPVVKINIGQSQFRSLLDSLGAQKYLGKGKNWQPGNVGNLWNKYINTGVKGDAKQYTEYDYALSEGQQKAYKNQIAAANIGRNKIYAAKFDRDTGKWKKDSSVDLSDFLDNDKQWTVTNVRFGAQGRTYIAQNNNGEVVRFVMPVGINPNVEKNIDILSNRAISISKTLRSDKLNGKSMTNLQRAQLEQEYNNAIQQAYLFQSQLGVQNNTKTQDFAAQAYQ